MSKLTYKDCVELKEAGFPQRHTFMSTNFDIPKNVLDGLVVHPTLEELIEACGDRFYSLTYKSPELWIVMQIEGINETQGNSPIQAVKNLYIALNKK